MMKKLSCLLLASTLGLSACTGSVDPATGTVFDNFGNLASGEFDRQIETRQAAARAIEAENARSQANIDALNRQRASNASQISSLRGEVSSLQSQIAAARQAAAADPGRLAQLDALSGQAAAVQADVSRGGDASIARAELRRIRSAVQALSS